MIRRLGMICLLCVWVGAGVAAAQVPEKRRQFVYGINAFAWGGYAGSLSARPAHTIYVLAGQPSVVSGRETLIYFWPITGDYRADWSSLNVPVPGTLEVLRGERVIASVPSQPYVIQYPQGPDGPSILYTGENARLRYQAFVRAREQWRQAMERYLRTRQAYLEALAKAGEARRRGQAVPLPPPPAEPEPLVLFSSEVHQGHVVNLSPGRYTIRLRRPDGAVVPSSQRTLVSFTHRREAVGYTIVPHTRWTVPERADDPGAVIYARPGQILYFQPFVEREYNDLAYTRLLNPQSREGRPDGWRWEYVRPVGDGLLSVIGSPGESRISRRPFRVVQTPGEALGYQVVEPSPGQAPDFEAYRVEVTGPLVIRLLDQAGQVLPGSTRLIRVPKTGPPWALTLIPFIPLTVGASAVAWRRQQLGRGGVGAPDSRFP